MSIIKRASRYEWRIIDKDRIPIPGAQGRTKEAAIATMFKSRKAYIRAALFGKCLAVRIDLDAGARAAKAKGK